MEEVEEGGQTTGEGQSVAGRLLIPNMRLKKKTCCTELVVVKYRIFLHDLPLHFPQRHTGDRERDNMHVGNFVFDCNLAAELPDSDWSDRGGDGLTEQEIDGIIDECLSLPIPNPKPSFNMSPFWSHNVPNILHSQQLQITEYFHVFKEVVQHLGRLAYQSKFLYKSEMRRSMLYHSHVCT